ncbi:DUF6174 domain-containing protein [Actinoplanes sp. NPDC051346]|uniref:DUF6174 domain-containing protein n=1 Tax=Actinoplanes sp. NPDC051346 TaxID=3155048 RepID=UPI0034204B7E
MIAGGACLLALAAWAIPARSPAAWNEPPAYEYTVEFRCDMAFPPGRYTLTVANGRVEKARGADAFSENVMTVRKMKPEHFPTLGDLFEDFQRARSAGADVAKVSVDPEDGHPTRIRLDYRKESVDDESCSDIVGFTPR